MQPACSLHAGCYILHAGCCNLQPPAYDRMQAACRLHAACMQPATSCMQLAATCCNLQPPAYDRIHKVRDNRYNFSSTPTCRASTPTGRASTPALRRRLPSKIRSRESRDRINISSHIVIEIRSKLSWMTLKTSLSLELFVALPQS